MNRGKRLAALLSASFVVAVGSPVAAAAPVQRLALVLKRTTTGPSSFKLDIGVHNDTRGDFIGEVGARIEKAKPVSAVPGYAGSMRRWEDDTLRAGDLTFSSCQVQVCHDDVVKGYHGLGTSYRDEGGADAPNYFFVVAYGYRVAFAFRGEGWRAYRAPLTYRYVDGPQDATASTHVLLAGAEVFTAAAAPGGRSGSLAAAFPPCSVAASGVVGRGAGRVTLAGGAEPAEAICPATRSFLGSYARGSTEWSLTGPAAGDSTANDTRLFVLDLPKHLP